MLKFSPPPENGDLPLIQTARKIVDEEIRPTVVADDLACRFRREIFDCIARYRLHSLTHPTDFGGLGRSHRAYYPVLLELGRGSIAMSVSVSVTNLVQGAIASFGTQEQKDFFYRNLVEGRWMGAFSLSEPQSGSDAAGLRLSAKKTAGGYRLNGTKCWCSNAGHADVYLVMSRTGEHRTKGITAFLVPKETPGFRVGKLEKKLGLAASTLAELIFEDVFVPDSHRVGDEGQGFEVALSQLDAGRISIGAISLAAVIEATEIAWRWTLANHDAPLWESTRHRLAGYFAEAQAIYTLMLEAASLKDRAQKFTLLASQVKLLASELAMRSTSDAVHLMGREGARPENHVERFFRDSKALTIVEGTTQIQQLVLSRELDGFFKQ